MLSLTAEAFPDVLAIRSIDFAGLIISEQWKLDRAEFEHEQFKQSDIDDFADTFSLPRQTINVVGPNNGGYEGSVIVQEIKKRKGNEGFNAATGEYEDLVKAGVVDPKKVTRAALQNASSIAGLLLTTECLITDMPEKDKPAAGGDHHGPGGMDM